MKVVTVSFDYASSDGRYKRLLDVFTFSLQAFGHDVVSLTPAAPPDSYKARRFQTSNNYKLSVWIDTLQNLADDCIFCDCDMLCLGPLGDAWREEFDLAYTIRSAGANVPVNAGVVFARYNKKTIRFLEKWRKIDNAMYLDSKFRGLYAQRYCGQNQASFGFMLERHGSDLAKLAPLPCRVWNVCDEDWPAVNEASRLVHVKSRLRDAVCSNAPVDLEPVNLRKCMDLWYTWERRMRDAEKIPLGSDSK